MFTLKSEAYLYLIHFLWSSEYKQNPDVVEAIEKLKLALENHEQDIPTVLKVLGNITNNDKVTIFAEGFIEELTRLKENIKKVNFTLASPQQRYENPLRRQLDSIMAIKLLMQPTQLMMESVNTISRGIIGILNNYDSLPKKIKKIIDTFLISLENLQGRDQYEAAISLGSFWQKPDLKKVIEVLNKNDETTLSQIMHIHFKFALIASKDVPLTSTPLREPVGKLKKIIDEKEPGGYKDYFRNLAKEDFDPKYNAYLADKVIYSSSLYKAGKGKLGKLDYSRQTYTLGLMREEQLEEAFPKMPLPWVADVKAQTPDLKSRVTLDTIENDSIYVAGPSGMTSLFLHLLENVGNFESVQQKQSYLAAICGYIVGGGFHSFHEVLAPAAYSLELIPGYEVTIPDVRNKTKSIPPKFGLFYQTLSSFDEQFKKLREEVWEQQLNSMKTHTNLLNVNESDGNEAIQQAYR